MQINDILAETGGPAGGRAGRLVGRAPRWGRSGGSMLDMKGDGNALDDILRMAGKAVG